MALALITGSSSGIGLATARMLAAAGWRVLAVARRADRLADLERETGGDCVPVVLDVTTAEAPATLAAAVRAHGGKLDALINNAGVFSTAAPAEQDFLHLERMLAVNLRAPILITRACLGFLTAAKGRVVNISSVAADTTFTGCGVYSATKAALDAWSRILREELRACGVRVCVVAPGATATEAFPGDFSIDPAKLCRAEDIAAAVRTVLEQAPGANIDRLVITPPTGAL